LAHAEGVRKQACIFKGNREYKYLSCKKNTLFVYFPILISFFFVFFFVLKILWSTVGDDVRQDMMALQIIEFCKGVFEKQKLDVFLFPYKVIATHPNEGIIEVME
jgi:hypothetical protein